MEAHRSAACRSTRWQPLEVYYAGRGTIAVFATESEVRGLVPDMEKLRAFGRGGFVATAAGEEFDCVSRFFCPSFGIGADEDPVTGSAHCSCTKTLEHQDGDASVPTEVRRYVMLTASHAARAAALPAPGPGTMYVETEDGRIEARRYRIDANQPDATRALLPQLAEGEEVYFRMAGLPLIVRRAHVPPGAYECMRSQRDRASNAHRL